QLDILDNILEYYDDGVSEEIFNKLDKNEKKIDKYEVKLDNQIINVIVLYKPVASDLRQLFAIYRMVINLERIGDLVMKIVGFIKKIKDSELLKKSSGLLRNMLKVTSKMTNNALLSFTNMDNKGAFKIMKKDTDIDGVSNRILKKTIKSSEESEEFQGLLISMSDISSIISSIERIGDHSTNIAEASVYALLGENVMHKKSDKKD
ncbi:MAG: phosphate uptake regulator PhoU, partial [Bacteroidota bacterium]|nr:phosphate uptake regulator PhoU [Bacteroidota bacterium]